MAAHDGAAEPAPAPGADLADDVVLAMLSLGELQVTGRLTDASNISLVGTLTLDGVELECVYKPIRGERPLWDFPDGTLAEREVSAFRIARLAGWDCVPPTVLRSGPYGDGMVQQWIDAEPYEALVDLLPVRDVPAGWLPVLRARDDDGAELAVAHADDPRLALLAGFDLVVNNADRKASHILPTGSGRVLGVDHGLTLHTENKLRTILWGFAGSRLPDVVVDGLGRLDAEIDSAAGLSDSVTRVEWSALHRRISRLISKPVFPQPPANRTPIPWPPL